MNSESLSEWSDRLGLTPPMRGGPTPAILRNHRLNFPAYDEAWGGGVADAAPELGKSVAGALFNLHRISLKQLDRFFLEGSRDARSTLRAKVTVGVYPYFGGEPVQAVTYRLQRSESRYVPPTSHYMSRLIESAVKLGLSSLWVMQLQSFATQPGQHFPARLASGAPLRLAEIAGGSNIAGGGLGPIALAV